MYDPSVGLLLYVNGELVGTAAIASGATFGLPTVDGAKYLCIGADSNATGTGETFYKGSIYQVSVYSTVISYENVLYLYQNQ